MPQDEFERGRLEGKVAAMEKNLDSVQKDQTRIFEKLDLMGDTQAAILEKVDHLTKHVNDRTPTDKIIRRATEATPAVELKVDNDIFNLAGTGFKNAFVKMIEYSVLLGFLGGAAWALGIFA